MGIRDKVVKNKVSSKLSDMKITIAGRPKVGKTSLFYKILKREGGLDSGLLMAFEKGYSFLPDINVVDITSWSEFVEYVDELVFDADGYKYLALDTVDIAGKLCVEYVLKKASSKDGKRYETLADMGFGKAYDLLETEFSKQVGRLEQAGFGLFFITHDKDKQIEEKSGLKYDKTFVSVSGRVGDYIKNSSDFIVFIDIEKEREKSGKETKVSESRKIRFRGDGTTEAGGRIVNVPEVIDYDVDGFLKTIYNSVKQQTELLSGGTTEESKPKAKAEKAPAKKEKPKKTESIDEIKKSIGEHLAKLDTEDKKGWAKRFNSELGDMNYTKSDDLDKLKELLTEMQ